MMNRKLTVIVSTLAIAAAAAVIIPAMTTQAQTTPPPTGQVEHHPRIRAAIRALTGAKIELQNAPHDFGGHRQAALDECDKAIAQLKVALQYDKQ
jgi:hypothetical protein